MKHRPKKLAFRPARVHRPKLHRVPQLPWCGRITQDMIRAASPLGSHLRQWGTPTAPAGPQGVGFPPFEGDLYAHLSRGRQRPAWLVVDDVLDNPSERLREAQPELVPLGPITVRVVGPGGNTSAAYLVNSLASTGTRHYYGRGQLHYPTAAEEAAEMSRLDAMTQEEINAEFGITDDELLRLQEDF